MNTSQIILVVLSMFRKFLFVSLTITFVLPAIAQKTGKRKLLKTLANIQAFEQAQVGIQLLRLSDGKVLAQYQQDQYFTPASNIKLLTTLAAMQTFDSLPALSYQEFDEGHYRIQSTGYPLLAHPKHSDSLLYNWLKGADSLVYHIQEEKSLNRLGPGWSWDDATYYYSAVPSIFPIQGNVIRLTQEASGAFKTRFPLFSVAENKDLESRYERDFEENLFQVHPDKVDPQDTLLIPFIPSEKTTHQLMSVLLKKPLGLSSKTLSDTVYLYTGQDSVLYRAVLQNSDNLISENLLLMVAQERLGQFSAEAIISELSKEWVSAPDKWIWVDGSGLSRYNLVTPRNLIWVLKHIYKEWGPNGVQSHFPEVGLSGNLKGSSLSERLPRVFAKTGTLRNNHNLSGYILNKDNEWYAFSIMVNQHTTKKIEVRNGIQILLEVMTKHF